MKSSTAEILPIIGTVMGGGFYGRADVLALVPVGKAVRGAEWMPK